MLNKIKTDNIGILVFNVSLLFLIFFLIFRSSSKDDFLSRTAEEQVLTADVNKICIQNEWDECYEFPQKTKIQILLLKPSISSNDSILYIKPPR